MKIRIQKMRIQNSNLIIKSLDVENIWNDFDLIQI